MLIGIRMDLRQILCNVYIDHSFAERSSMTFFVKHMAWLSVKL